jgi:hypothetical protein
MENIIKKYIYLYDIDKTTGDIIINNDDYPTSGEWEEFGIDTSGGTVDGRIYIFNDSNKIMWINSKEIRNNMPSNYGVCIIIDDYVDSINDLNVYINNEVYDNESALNIYDMHILNSNNNPMDEMIQISI